MKIGFIGLGNVGGKLARSLLRNKFNLTVIDLDYSLVKDFISNDEDLDSLGVGVYNISICYTLYMFLI